MSGRQIALGGKGGGTEKKNKFQWMLLQTKRLDIPSSQLDARSLARSLTRSLKIKTSVKLTGTLRFST